MARTEGTKYAETKRLMPVEIAALIRAELKAAKADTASPLHGLTFSVRCRHYDSINVEVDGLADDEINNFDGWHHTHTERANAIDAAVTAIAWAYNFDDSDSMSDYWHKRFWFHVNFVDSSTRQWRADEKARLAARRSQVA